MRDRSAGVRGRAAPHHRIWPIWWFFLFCLLFPGAAALAKKGEASFQVVVPAGQWKGARVKRIPAGAKIGVSVEADGPVAVLLLSGTDYERGDVDDPVFQGRTEDRLSFSVRAPVAGDYYVVIDNRTGSSARSVALIVSGETEEHSPDSTSGSEARLQQIERRLAKLFEFESFPIRLGRCLSGAQTDSRGIVLCREYLDELREQFDDESKMQDVLLFTLFHEIGHVLLRQWSYPTYASEETADEFATALIVMLDQEERLDSQAEFFRANASLLDVVGKVVRNDRHPLSAQRARNIQRWAQDESLVRRWQPVFVPRMKTPVLEQLLATPKPWTDVALVQAELETRR